MAWPHFLHCAANCLQITFREARMHSGLDGAHWQQAHGEGRGLRVQAHGQHLIGRRAPSACSTCAVLLLVRLSSWWRLRSSTMALMAATASTNSSDSVGPYGANGLTTAHHARLACASARVKGLLMVLSPPWVHGVCILSCAPSTQRALSPHTPEVLTQYLSQMPDKQLST